MRNIGDLGPSLLNGLTILLGATLGWTAAARIPPRIRQAALQATGLFVLVLGVQMSLRMTRPLNTLLSLALGAAAGQALDLDGLVARLSAWAERRLGGGAAAEAFVTSSVLFDVGALAVLGSFQAGLGQTPNLLLTKSVLDGLSALLLSATLGGGVLASAPLTAAYEGALTLAATTLSPLFRPAILQDFDAVGGLLVLAIGLGFLWRPPPVKVVNLLPALALTVILGWTGIWLHLTYL